MTHRKQPTTILTLVLAATLHVLCFGTAMAAPPAYTEGMDLPVGVPGLDEVVADEPVDDFADEDEPVFFDEEVPTDSSIIYVIDRSGSMSMQMSTYNDTNGNAHHNIPRLAVAKMELKQSIAALSADFKFNVIFYGSCIFEWRPTKASATEENKEDAYSFIDSITPGGWTNTAGAAGKALSDKDNKTLIVLSDGTPNFLDCAETSVVSDQEHRRIISALNTQGANIHCFAIAPSPEARAFMRAVASDSSGIYKEIN